MFCFSNISGTPKFDVCIFEGRGIKALYLSVTGRNVHIDFQHVTEIFNVERSEDTTIISADSDNSFEAKMVKESTKKGATKSVWKASSNKGARMKIQNRKKVRP
ncbi:hypothetical protein ACH5RR_041198 [Cinchona calisaya]|uniref:Uncharacterized protein n=1 Tax=Cinchona calisaya TaxID=153742 RepID=A0ABD2XUS9_9GENT